jgi:protein tyrosine phosphatase (PTP) superfamily phosphohydrolase (DUF442 family)
VIRRLLIVTFASGLAFAAGCHHKCCHHDACCRDGRVPPGTGSPILLPPAGVPTTPAPGGGAVVPGVGPVDVRSYPPPSFDPLRPGARPAPEVLFPDPLPGTGSSRGNSGRGVLGTPVGPQTAEPPVSSKVVAAPAGLPGYVRVKEGLASGRKPTLDGFDALKQAGFRTLIYLHPAGADLSAVKDVAARRGLAFIAIETTPEKLADAVEVFNAVAADKARHPAYVFDDDGVRAGTVWYLHFRTAEAMNDDVARVRAKPLGLTDQGDEARAFAIATQRYLESR